MKTDSRAYGQNSPDGVLLRKKAASRLFEPLRLNAKYELKNRLGVAPMTTSQSHADGTISREEIAWLERLSKDGYGMVISCASAISKTAVTFYNQMSFANECLTDELPELAGKMKRNGSTNIIQLCHGGSRTIPSLTGIKPRSASSYQMPMVPGFEPPAELSAGQIEEIVSDFVNACHNVEAAGFDGIEFHGANGYLFTQFISKMTNLRTDSFGGSLENRARFAREVVKACRKQVSKDFIIGFRISFENMGFETGLDIDENIQLINWLAADGIDYVHASSMSYVAPSAKYPDKVALAYIRQNVTESLPLIGVGGITSVEQAVQAMEYGADMVTLGRAAIGNTQIPNFFEKGESLPSKMPFVVKDLSKIAVSSLFIDYINNSPLSGMGILKKEND